MSVPALGSTLPLATPASAPRVPLARLAPARTTGMEGLVKARRGATRLVAAVLVALALASAAAAERDDFAAAVAAGDAQAVGPHRKLLGSTYTFTQTFNS